MPNRCSFRSQSWSRIACRIRLASARCGAGSSPTSLAISASASADQRGVVVAGVAIGHHQIDEAVVGGVGGPVGRVGVEHVEPPVGRHGARRDLQLAQQVVPGR
jgi:hypothetical protein